MNTRVILHISNDYSGSSVYKNLISKVDDLGVSQIVYTAVRDKSLMGRNRIHLKQSNSEIIYSNILSKYVDRIFLRCKVRKITRDVKSKINLVDINCVHAHTWFSDGGVAYQIFKEFSIPYIVTIRNTDLNLFQKYLVHQRNFGMKILENAAKIVLISESYKERLMQQNSLRSIRQKLKEKIIVIPNGVDDFWIENAVAQKKWPDLPVKVLYVGKFLRGKGVIQLQKAIEILNSKGVLVHLHLIGGGGSMHKNVLSLVDRNPQTMFYHGEIKDNSVLKTYFERSHFFAMPSKRETFGLVYAEALLQGLPILYTSNEGIDGFYRENIGEKVVSVKIENIRQQLFKLVENFDSYNIPILKIKKNHNWKAIAKIYEGIYDSVMN